MEFEWDENKCFENIRKHKIDFVHVLPFFSNSDALIVEDKRKDYGEARYILLCLEKDLLFQVAYTIREQGVIRIISARRANKRERKAYDKKRNYNESKDNG